MAAAPAPALWLGDTGSILTAPVFRAAEGVATERIGTPLADVANDSVPLEEQREKVGMDCVCVCVCVFVCLCVCC